MLSEDALKRERFRGDDVNLEIPSTLAPGTSRRTALY